MKRRLHFLYRAPALLAAPLVAALACSSGTDAKSPEPAPLLDDAQATACQSPAHLSTHGGGSRQGPATVVPVIWDVQNGPIPTLKDQIDDVYSILESSNYYKWVRSEYGAPALSHVPHVWFDSGWNPGDHSQAELDHDLDQAIRSGALPAPQNAVYAIHLAQGLTITSDSGQKACTNYLGYNTKYTTFDLNGGIETHYYYLVLDATACGLGFNGVTRVTSHELLENLTDPDQNGWEDQSQPASCTGGGPAQIGDLCSNQATTIDSEHSYVLGGQTLNTLTVQKMWSNAMNACVTEDGSTLPTLAGISPNHGGWGTVVTINGTNFDGPPAVTFGGAAATNVSCSSSTQCVATAPQGAGTVPVSITIDNTTLTSGFAYAPPPACTLSFNDIPSAQQCDGALNVDCPALYQDFLNNTSLAAPVEIWKGPTKNGPWFPFWQVNYNWPTSWPKVTEPNGTTDYFKACASGPPGDCDAPVSVQVTQYPCSGGQYPDFNLAISPIYPALTVGGGTSIGIGIGGQAGTKVSLAVTGMPAGVTASFNPAAVTVNGLPAPVTSTLSLGVAAGVAPQTLALTVTGSSSSDSHSYPLSVEILPAVACQPITCAAQGAVCGTISDGCGNSLNCGGCPGTTVCTDDNSACCPTGPLGRFCRLGENAPLPPTKGGQGL
ncbi:MAG TPA: IPT/TIG domain-containing protein [Polyangiaceae bacterium]|jgi:hypothetical protein